MSPESVEIVVVPRSLDRSTAGGITGPIWLRHGGCAERAADFPEANWVDFPVVILGWWLTELGMLARGGTKRAACRFMDGPVYFTAADAGPTLLRVRCLERRMNMDGDAVEAEFVVVAAKLYASVRAAALAVLAECDRRGWSDDRDVDALRRAVRESPGQPAD